jgi:hypothetical protein
MIQFVSVVVPAVVVFLSSIIGYRAGTRNTQRSTDAQRRNDMMQMIRWASEQVTSAVPVTSRMGISLLEQLISSELTTDHEATLATTVLNAFKDVYTETQDEKDQ